MRIAVMQWTTLMIMIHTPIVGGMIKLLTMADPEPLLKRPAILPPLLVTMILMTSPMDLNPIPIASKENPT